MFKGLFPRFPLPTNLLTPSNKAAIGTKNLRVEPDSLQSTVVDGSQCPDIIPVISLAATLCDGTTEIINAGRLRIKECDRLAAVTSELNKLGAKITEKEDGLIIEGVSKLKGGCTVWSHKDHRIAMSFSIADLVSDSRVILDDPNCINISFPGYFDLLRDLAK